MARATGRNQTQYKQGKSLRKKSADVQPLNVLYASTFAGEAMRARLGVYLKINGTTGSLRLKVYDEDETYEDSFLAAEDWAEGLLEYAEELGFAELLEERFAQVRREAAGRASAGRRGAGGMRDTTLPPSVDPGVSEGH